MNEKIELKEVKEEEEAGGKETEVSLGLYVSSRSFQQLWRGRQSDCDKNTRSKQAHSHLRDADTLHTLHLLTVFTEGNPPWVKGGRKMVEMLRNQERRNDCVNIWKELEDTTSQKMKPGSAHERG